MRRAKLTGLEIVKVEGELAEFTAYVKAGLGPSPNVPMAHAVGNRVLTLPLYPSMTEAQVTDVCKALAPALRQ